MITFRDFIIFLAENHCLGLYWSNLEFNCNVTGIRRFNQHLDFIFSGMHSFSCLVHKCLSSLRKKPKLLRLLICSL